MLFVYWVNYLYAIFNISFIFSLVGVLLGIAFFTLVERKVMGLMHYRKGPNKVILFGLLQPISDATKLLVKEVVKISPSKIFMYWFAPCLGIFLMLMCWSWYESSFNIVSNNMKIFLIMAIMSLTAFVFILTSWGSNTKYAILGGYRAVSQVISYEVCLMLFVFIVVYISKTYSVSYISFMQQSFWFMFFSLPFFFMWILMCMAESNRTPFDLAEGESEIVSGFNIEYGGGLFALIFIMEYGMLMFLGFLTSVFFLGANFLVFKTFFVSMMYIWIRCCFPRVRYDKLMFICWKVSLPYSIGLLFFILPVMFIM